ncbi:MAG: hypothetical protein GF317_09370 [Candidatus Lokiarchaeota archaeon]|nr:hypothetical protein [Candidatus Lokiarchaeota archaeon]MBD3199921.1 hypothetical protein [Candidatus Lokiarchaeota archaeon]
MKINQLDDKIIEIIKSLNSKSKPKISMISENIDISRQTFQVKFEEYSDLKIINEFTININPNVQPNLLIRLIEFKTNPTEPQIIDNLLEIPQLEMLDGIFGEFSLFSLFSFKNSKEFNQILSKIDKIMSNSYFKKYQIIEVIKVYKTNGIRLSDYNFKDFVYDETNEKILEILKKEQGKSLLSTYEIKNILKRVYDIEKSQSTVYNRIKEMEDLNIIINYCVNFNPKKIGFNGKFYLRIKPKDPSNYDEIASDLVKKPEITDLYRIGTEFGIFSIIRVKEIDDYGIFLQDLYDSGEIEDTYTNFVLDERIPFTNFIIPSYKKK